MARKNTRAAQGAGTIRKKNITRNGKEYTYWEARVTIGRDPGTGKQIQKSFTGKTQKEVREKMQAASVELNSGTYIEPSKLTVAQWLDIWKDEYLTTLKTGSLHTYQKHIEYHIKPTLGSIKLDKLTPHMIQTFYNSEAKGKSEEEKGLSPSTLRMTHAIFCAALKQAVKLGYIRNNPAEYCILPRQSKKEIKPLDESESKAFLQEIKGHPLEALFTVALFTGMREGELLGLTWDCVSFENGSITIKKQLQRNPYTKEYQYTTTKNGKQRIINPAPWVMKLLKKHRIKQNEIRLLAGPAWTDENLVFTNEAGRYLINSSVIRNLKTVAKNIGRADLRFHDLRHSYAVASLRAGDDFKTIQENLGHASANTTLNIYAHVTMEMKQASADRMENYINAVLNF